MDYPLPYDAVAAYLGADEGEIRAAARRLGIAGRSGLSPRELDRLLAALAPLRPPYRGPTPGEIRAVRAQLGLTARAFGALLQVSCRTVARWEEGERAIPADLRPAFDALIPRQPPRRPVLGDAVALHRLGPADHLAVSGGMALAVRPDQLAVDLTPPARLVLDASLPWVARPAALPPPLAVYTVAVETAYVLALARDGVAASPEEPAVPAPSWREWRHIPRTKVEEPVKLTYIAPAAIPAPAPRVRGNAAVAEARGHLERARRTGQAITITFEPDERSKGTYARYRSQANRLGMRITIIVGEWRPYPTRTGKTGMEPAAFYIRIDEAQTGHAATPVPGGASARLVEAGELARAGRAR